MGPEETPPNLREWRERLFHAAETFSMTEDEWNTYWPHIDNVWSHRSTQTSKNGPSKTHYYDCRLKGRPPGVAPSLQNPDRKKRKRVARDRDLCDMKIKITESVGYPRGARGKPVKTYTVERVKREVLHRPTPGGGYVVEKLNREELIAEHQLLTLLSEAQPGHHQQQLEDGVNSLSMAADSLPGEGDGVLSTRDSTSGMAPLLAQLDSYGVPGFLGEVHRHSLEHSDAIKKSSVERDWLKRSKELKKQQRIAPSNAPRRRPSPVVMP